MSLWAYVNGFYCLRSQARVPIEDRGFQFADGVYEVVSIYEGRMPFFEQHCRRLEYSLREVRLSLPVDWRVFPLIVREVLRRNSGVRYGMLYIQVTRGVARRNFLFPCGVRGTLVILTYFLSHFGTRQQVEDGVHVFTIPDIRWQRRDIKTIGLLPQVLGKQGVFEAGGFEGWQVDEQGYITEGCSSNAWIVDERGVVITRHTDTQILSGVTRLSLLECLKSLSYTVEVRAFTKEEAYGAREAFLTSATTFVLPIVRIDDRVIGTGKPGPVSTLLRQEYLQALTLNT